MIFSDWSRRHWRQVRGEAIALHLNDEQLSWHELCARIDELTSSFTVQGVVEGSDVMSRAWNTLQTLLAWPASLQYGVWVLLVDPQLLQSLLEELLPNLTLRSALVSEGENTFPALAPPHIQLAEGIHAAAWQPTCLRSMTLTSDSTGLPRVVVRTYQAHPASAEGALSLIPFGDHDDWSLPLPLLHVSGQGTMRCWLYAGAWMTVCDKQPLEQMLAGCTHASLVSTQLWRLLINRSSVFLKAVLLGGAAIPVELTEQVHEQEIRCFCGYGLTELTSAVRAKEADGLTDVGSPLPGREVKIVNDGVWLRTASMAEGHWCNGQRVPLVNDEGQYVTCDRGEMHNGKLTIVGRLDNLFFSGGKGIQPEEVEYAIAIHPAVLQVFIILVADKEFGHRPVAMVEYDQQSVDLDEWMKDKLVRFQQPVRWLTLPPELKNGDTKISCQALEEWIQRQQ